MSTSTLTWPAAGSEAVSSRLSPGPALQAAAESKEGETMESEKDQNRGKQGKN